MPLFNQTLFDQILGSTMSTSAISALGGDYASYVTKFQAFEPSNWTTYGSTGNGSIDFIGANYYDTANRYYAWYKMSGYSNATYLSRAAEIAAYYRDNLQWTAGNQPQPHNTFSKGIALHYASTGDALSLASVRNNADYICASWVPHIVAQGFTGNDERIVARSAEGLIMGILTGAVTANGSNYSTNLTTVIDFILNNRESDGPWRSSAQSAVTFPNRPWCVRPFYCGQIMDALILYYHVISADSRIPTAIQACCTYLIAGSPTDLWQLTTVHPSFGTWHNTFKYIEYPTFDEPGSAVYGEPVLNGLVINGFAFTYARTGLQLWKDRTELILNGAALYSDVNGVKRFNEVYSYSYKAPALLNAAVIENDALAAQEAPDTASIIGRSGTSIRLNWV